MLTMTNIPIQALPAGEGPAYTFAEEAHLTTADKMFFNQFGGHGRSVDYNTLAWLDGSAADLKQAMCRETARLYAPLLQVREDLAQKHAELGRAWQVFALRQASFARLRTGLRHLRQDVAITSGVPDPGFPPYYLIGENIRDLLAYAARIALDQSQIIPKGERE